MSDWFAPKRFGWGAGWPISWQGWAITAAFVIVAAATVIALARRPLLMLAILVPAVAIYAIVAARTTRGGWHWRWGGDV